MIQSPQDTLDTIKPMNSSPKIIGGLAFKPTFGNMLTDVRLANELEFIETNHMHPYNLMKYLLSPGNIFQSISLDLYQNPTATMPY